VVGKKSAESLEPSRGARQIIAGQNIVYPMERRDNHAGFESALIDASRICNGAQNDLNTFLE
jgi:hypothetical protein